MSLFDADEYLEAVDEPAESAAQPADEVAPVPAASVALAELPPDASDEVVDAVLEAVSIEVVGPPVPVADPPPAPRSVADLWANVVFQPSAVAALQAAARQPVHAYLLTGTPGNGSLVASVSFAAALLCAQGGCGGCDVCHRVLGHSHPDVVMVEREGASISVDQAREIIRLALRSPVEGERKVLILTDFHLVTSAGPTLLKIIEEPPPSTVFVILADHVTPELVTIASRCVQIPFVNPTSAQIISALIKSGLAEDRAERVAEAAGGRLDRALLLAADEQLASRLAFWAALPARLDGSGAAVSVLAAEAASMLDHAAVGPLEARQATEVAALEARIEQQGTRGSVGLRKELVDRHKRELKRLRDDELRLGLSVLLRRYRAALLDDSIPTADALAVLERLDGVNEHLDRNPNLGLLLQALFLRLPRLAAAA